jgi:hypothetical protein
VLLSDLGQRGVDGRGQEEPSLTHIAMAAVMEKILVPGDEEELYNQTSSRTHNVYTVEPLNKGHYGSNNFVLPCREVVPIADVK